MINIRVRSFPPGGIHTTIEAWFAVMDSHLRGNGVPSHSGTNFMATPLMQ